MRPGTIDHVRPAAEQAQSPFTDITRDRRKASDMTDTLLKTHPELAWQETPGADPYIALESLDDAAVDTWVTAQNTRTTGAFGKTPETDALTARLKAAYTSQERIVSCSRYADWGYNTWQDDTHPLGIVRRTPWAAWLAGKPEWQTILDVDTLDLNQKAGDATRWALHDFDMLYPTWDRALVSLSPGGSDACMVREFDVESRTFVEDGFTLPDVGKHGISWIDRDTVYVGWDDSARSKKPALTTSGFPRQARKWTRGTALADAPVVFEGTRRDVSAGVDYDPLENLHLASRAVTFFETLQYWLDESTGAWQQYDVPLHAELEHWNGWLFVTPREDYAVWRAPLCERRATRDSPRRVPWRRARFHRAVQAKRPQCACRHRLHEALAASVADGRWFAARRSARPRRRKARTHGRAAISSCRRGASRTSVPSIVNTTTPC